jgi:hypothetical protein
MGKVNQTATCWLWTGAVNDKGYGWVSRTRALGPTRAHRFSWEIHRGQIPKGKCVLHKCDVPLCVNPDHLFLGTRKDNTRDMMRKGRCINGERASWSKLTEKEVREILKSKDSQRTLARRYGVIQQTISSIKRRINWKHVD